MKDFFISYSTADRSWAEWIAWNLEEAGYSTVIQAWDIRPGSNFALDIRKATRETERIIAVLSPDYLDSLYTQSEWVAAFKQDPTGEKGKLLPVRVRECKPTGLLATTVYIDLVGMEDESVARETLLAGIRRMVTARAFPKAVQFPGSQQSRFSEYLQLMDSQPELLVSEPTKIVEVFLSYVHADENLRNE